jgi:hypothetical protein
METSDPKRSDESVTGRQVPIRFLRDLSGWKLHVLTIASSLIAGALAAILTIGPELDPPEPGDPTPLVLSLQATGVVLVLTLGAWYFSYCAPAGAEIPPLAKTVSREGWHVLLYLCCLFSVISVSVLITVAGAEALRRFPHVSIKLLPLASVVGGLVFGGSLCALLRNHIKGPLDVVGVLGTSVTIFSALGFAIAALVP